MHLPPDDKKVEGSTTKNGCAKACVLIAPNKFLLVAKMGKKNWCVQSEFLLFKGVDLEGVHSFGVGHPDVQGSSNAESRGLDASSQDRLIQELVWMEGQQRLSWLLQMARCGRQIYVMDVFRFFGDI